MHKLKFILPAAVLAAGFAACTSVSYGNVAMAKKEKAKCLDCHTKNGSKELNDGGKYYQKNKTLDGYKK
jgi:hypothetical protein